MGISAAAEVSGGGLRPPILRRIPSVFPPSSTPRQGSAVMVPEGRNDERARSSDDVKEGKHGAAALLVRGEFSCSGAPRRCDLQQRRSRAATVFNTSSEAPFRSPSSQSTATTRVLGDAAAVMGGG
nr:hypothetical protein Iba_chr15aCG12760 [Ipomoea batatas]